ncbi:unnamed protein product [Spirodela intermedia]|uniref:Uncharacterized protein n=1 Tax=Spirodela intermedia TaxID=51605 RepID=A0A7I8LG39_SPIIN|nr:unnamed protein product [Spirodela intermedia]
MKVKRYDHAGAGSSTSPSSSAAAGEDDGDRRSPKRPNRQSEVAAKAEGSELGAAEEAREVRDGGESVGLRLLGLLLRCAEAVAMDRLAEAQMLLPEISELSSPYGSSPERVAAYFAEAIHARIVSSHIGVYSSLSAASSTASLPFCRKLMVVQNQKIAQAFQVFNAISPFVKFAHFTANQAIFQALEGEESVHVIDLDIMQGLQWPGLFHILASRHGHKIRSIRITGVGSSLELLDATGRRLSDFAAALGLAFEFHPLEVKIGHITDPSVFHWQPPDSRREVTVVNWMHHCLYDVTGSDLGAVRLLQALRPKLVVIVEQDLTHSGGFLQRFVEALHYYSAMFDALGEAAAAAAASGEEERFQVERQLLGTEIRNIVAVGGPKRTGEVKIERWSDKLERAGFRMMNLAGGPAAAQAGLLLGMLPCKGYTLVEEGGCLKLGWKDLSLLTASAWQPYPTAVTR